MTTCPTLRKAAQRLSDKRTLMDDGFWVSQREMRYLDAALAATPPPLGRERFRDAASALCDFAARFSAGDSDVQREDLQVAIDEVRAALAPTGDEP